MALSDYQEKPIDHLPTLQHTAISQPSSTRSRSADWLLGGLAVAVPVVLFWIVWSQYAVNVPKWDDHALRAFLYYFDQETTFSGKVYQFFRQHNEHRIVFDRAVAYLDYHLTGKLNFRHLMAIGNLSLIGIVLVLIALFRREGRSIWYVVPAPFLLLNLANWENMYWGMAALQNFWVVFWVVLACYVLAYTHHWKGAIVVAILATLTSGNGLLIWPIGAVLIILRSVDRRTLATYSFVPLLGWIASAILISGLYFVGYEKPAGNPPDRGPILNVVKGWLSFIGASAEALPVQSALRASLLFGCILAFLSVVGIGWGLLNYGEPISRIIKQLTKPAKVFSGKAIPAITLFFWGVMAYILGTAAVVAWGRTGFGLDIAITSRYKIYSLLLLVVLYVYSVIILGKQAGSWVMKAGIVGSILFYWSSYFSFLDDAIGFRHWLTTSQFNWTYTTAKPVSTVKREIYTEPAPAFYDVALPAIYGPAQQTNVPLTLTKVSYGHVVETDKTLPTGLLERQTLDRDAGSYLLARSSKRSYLFPVSANKRSIIKARLWPGNQFSEGFKADIRDGEMENGTYQLFVLSVSPDNRCTIYPTNQYVTSVGRPNDIQKNW